MPGGDENGAEVELIAVLHLLIVESIFRTTLLTEINFGRLNPAGQFPRAADQISVNVGLENVRNSDVLCARHLNVNVNIGSRIEDCRHAFVVITN